MKPTHRIIIQHGTLISIYDRVPFKRTQVLTLRAEDGSIAFSSAKREETRDTMDMVRAGVQPDEVLLYDGEP